MAGKKRNGGKKKEKSSEKSLVGCTSANFHEAGRSEYLAHYVFSSFGTSVPVARQEDTGLDLYCTLTERVGQRLWPTASFCVQVKSTPDPWEFADPRSIQWIVEHPLPVFLCVVNKKSARLSLYHTSPRFYAWSSEPDLKRMVMIPGPTGKGYGMPWEHKEYESTKDDEFPLSAPIAEFGLTDILDDAFHGKIHKILSTWVEMDRKNIFRIQAGLRVFETINEYTTNEPEVTGYSRSWRSSLTDEEREVMLGPFIEQAKLLSRHLAAHDDLMGVLRVDLILRYFNALDWMLDGVHGHYLYASLRSLADAVQPPERKEFYAGLDVVSQKLDDLTAQIIQEALQQQKDEENATSQRLAQQEQSL